MDGTRSFFESTAVRGDSGRLSMVFTLQDASQKKPAQFAPSGFQGLHLASYLVATGGLEITTSTRRFCCRPAAESLSATGELSPLPSAASRVDAIP